MLIKCDNHAVVQVLHLGRTKDPFLGTCARNIWLEAARCGVDLAYKHVLGQNNVVADLLSRWGNTPQNWAQLLRHVNNPVWLPVQLSMLNVDNNI